MPPCLEGGPYELGPIRGNRHWSRHPQRRSLTSSSLAIGFIDATLIPKYDVRVSKHGRLLSPARYRS
jgi:hypothetical protein